MAQLRCALYGIRATDIDLTVSTIIPGVVRIDLGCGVYVEVGGVSVDAEAEAAAMDRLAELATEAAARLREVAAARIAGPEVTA
ncbi:hypothetical protein AB0O28_31800 [Microbispora sp. NPDC088329]|uniref:hypothetical protein n=1 Tax=Microbispora sp. NPDC088329 TaxID=3154869 RepID=UPI003449F14D